MNTRLVQTPNYVLLHDKQRISPELLPLDSGQDCIAIYGFSDKQPYDQYCTNSDLELVPYPLVSGFLRNQIETAGTALLIIVIDAAGPDEQAVDAAQMKYVLDAHEKNEPQVSADYRLVKNEPTLAYRVEQHDSVAQLRLQ